MQEWRKELVRQRAAYLSQNEAGLVLQNPEGALASAVLSGGLSERDRLQDLANSTLPVGAVPPAFQLLLDQFQAAQAQNREGGVSFFSSRLAQQRADEGFWQRYVLAYNERVLDAQVSDRAPEAEAIQKYRDKSLSADYWEHDFLALMSENPSVARQIIEAERDKNEQHQKKTLETSEDLQEAIHAVEQFKKKAPDSSWLKNAMADIDTGKDPFEQMCASPELEAQLIEYKQLKIKADEARILCGGDDCTNPETNPLLKLLKAQSDLLSKLNDANDGKGDKAEAAKAYGDFIRKNEAILEALQQGDVKQAMHLASPAPSEARPKEAFHGVAYKEPYIDLSALNGPEVVEGLVDLSALGATSPAAVKAAAALDPHKLMRGPHHSQTIAPRPV